MIFTLFLGYFRQKIAKVAKIIRVFVFLVGAARRAANKIVLFKIITYLGSIVAGQVLLEAPRTV